MRTIVLLLALIAVVFATTGAGESKDFPGGTGSLFPQDQGGDINSDGPFENQPQISGFVDRFGTQFDTTPFIGAVERVGQGADPVRHTVGAYPNVQGHSSGSVTGRSGRGAASGDGFFISQTKFPERVGLDTESFIVTEFSSSASLVTAPIAFVVTIMMAMLVFL